jgi:DUF4097 and DUF4098 domain-containing protein YvlB
MRIIFFSFIVIVRVLSVPAHADDWSKVYNLTDKPELRIETHDANVRIVAWDQDKIEAHVSTRGWQIGNGGLEIVERQQGNAVDIQLREPHRAHFFIGVDNRRTELEIHMPRSATVNVQSGDGAIEAKGLAGELDFSTVDGKIEIEDVDGSLHAHTSDGAMRVTGRFDALNLRTSDGRVEVEARQGSQVRQPWDIRSSDGSVALRIPGDLAADVELHTSDGSITTDIPIAVEGTLGRHDIHGKINGGGNRVTVHTSDGSVRLDKL